MSNPILSGDLPNLANLIAATGGLGAASMGLVDTTKVFGGGPSNFGFGYIRETLKPYLDAMPASPSASSSSKILQTLKADWLNGTAKADQKAKAKSLIHAGLMPNNAPALATAAGVDQAALQSLAQNVAQGQPNAPQEINALAQFDLALSATIDAAYERGDQKYRNANKFLSMVVSVILGGVGGLIVFGFYDGWHMALCLLVGLMATPLAPVSKDLASALQAAVSTASKLKS